MFYFVCLWLVDRGSGRATDLKICIQGGVIDCDNSLLVFEEKFWDLDVIR